MSKRVRRLFRQFQPAHYAINLDIDPEEMVLGGSVVIDGKKIGRPSERLTFHQNGLTVTGATITRHDKSGDKEIPVKRINHHASFNEVRLHAEELLYPGNYTFKLNFKSKITRQMNGVYPCFFELNGQQKKLIATQFESHHAREAFPCIDEPEAKATFDLSLQTPAKIATLSNTPIKSQKESGGKLATIFETTPRMSTYLLAFVIGELKYKEAKTKHGVVVRTYATPENVDFTDFALDVAVKCLEFFNEYFDTPYPLPKCDLIALPDFASGAMENWGCVTFREQALFVDEKNTSLSMKQYVANVVAHELAHQWFGNLVTMRWWNDLWLNESFASWISYLAVDSLFPDWQVWNQFIVDEQSLALKADSLENTHPIEVTINHPDEIRTIFDAISYEKGASVLLMLQNYVGANEFRDGLRLYLKTHAYKNTEGSDLWDAIEQVSQQPVQKFMKAWTGETGYPIVKAEVDDKNLKLSQHRFVLNPAARKRLEKEDSTVWPVPKLSSVDDKTLFDKSESNDKLDDDVHLKLNHSQSGFYRVVYNASHLAKLGELVQRGRIEPLDRLSILSDAFETAKAGYSSTTDALHLLKSYSDEDSVLVWDIISSNLANIKNVMNDESLREDMKPYVRKLTAKQLARLGIQEKLNDTHFDKLLRPVILGMAAASDEPAVVKWALGVFSRMKTPEDAPPDLRGIVYATSARLGGEKEFDKLLAMHEASSSSEDRVTIAAAITGFEDPKLIKRALALITTNSVRLQDAGYWIAYSFGNRHAKKMTWDWMREHWDWLEKNMGTDLSFFRMPNYAARAFSDTSFLPEFSEFFKSVMSPAFERPIKQAIETIEWQSAWRKRDVSLIKTFFKS